MERILQYLDDLDDLFGAMGLLAERLRKLGTVIALFVSLFVVTTAGIVLALSEPQLGLAVVILLFVLLLYRSVTAPTLPSQVSYDTA